MSKQLLSLVLLLTLLGAEAPVSQGETLQDIYALAVENDHQLKADTAAYRAGQENLTISRARLLPQLNATARFSDSEQDFTGFQSSIDASVSGSTEVESEIYSLSLTQPLLDLSAWFDFRQGQALSRLAKAQFGADQQNLIVRVAESYFNVLRAVDNLETALAEEKALSHQLEQTEQRFEVGLTAITEVHEAQAAYDSATATTLSARGALGIAFEELEVLTGQSHNSIAPLVDTFPVHNPDPLDRHPWVEFALQNNYQLQVAKLNAEAARQNARARAAGHLPRVTAAVNYVERDDSNIDVTYADSSLNRDDRVDEQTTVAVQVDVPLFSGLGTSGQRRQAEQLKIQAREQFNRSQRDIIQGARSLHLTVVTNVAQIAALKQAIKSSHSALEATQAGYDVGTRNLVDVLVAQRNLYQAQRNYDDNRYEYVVNMLRLKEVAGNLTPADLNQLNNWLDAGRPVKRSGGLR